MSMPSSKITVPSSNTDATSNPQQNTSEKINQAKLNRINNPTPSTSKVEIEKKRRNFELPW